MQSMVRGLVGLFVVGVVGCSGGDEPPPTGGTGGSGGEPEVAMLQAPASPEQGWQYDVPVFPVEFGEEIQDCYFFEVPYDEPVYANKITVAQNEGSHHFNVFRVKTIKGLSGKPGEKVAGGECWKSINWSDWPLVSNMQSKGVNEWELPEGVAHRFEPRELLMV